MRQVACVKLEHMFSMRVTAFAEGGGGMRCVYYTEWCECNDCEMHRMGIEMYDSDGIRYQEEQE